MFDAAAVSAAVPAARPRLTWQPSLLDSCADGGRPVVDETFAALRRLQLDACCWVDHCPGWLAGSDTVFADLLTAAHWEAREVVMWGALVAEPRLTARWRREALPLVLEQVRVALSARYALGFDSVGVNLYRDGRDSVAWHRDRVGARLREPLVATVTLGARRRFLLRPRDPDRRRGATHLLRPASGDLVVMGGACQQEWEHCVPKVAAAGPRMAITVRRLLERDAA